MASSYSELPKTHRALVLTSTSTPPTVQIVPTVQPTSGSVVVKILAASVLSYARQIVDGTRKYPFPLPFILGSGAVARVAAIGPDTTVLSVGQLVLVDVTIRGRDDPKGQVFLFGVHEGHTEGSRKLMHGEWRNATYSEYAKVPLENCNALDEARLLGQENLGYKVEDLAFLSRFAVPYGGLRDIGIKAGKTVIIAPASGPFGGAAVIVALTMGRNAEALNKIIGSHDRAESVQITGDERTELAALHKFGPIDAFFDISPPAAANSSHIKSGIRAVVLAIIHRARFISQCLL